MLFLANGILLQSNGKLAQMVERPLCMREVPGSMPGFSNFFLYFFITVLILVDIILLVPNESNN